MTRTATAALRAAAARNNADWCASVCRSHGIAGTFGDTAWRSARRPPPYYPDVVTLRPEAVPADFLPDLDTARPGFSVKDSFASADLTPHGFVELFTAHWIHRPAALPAPGTPALRAERVSAAIRLRDWQAAWHGGDAAPDVFRPALLDDPAVLVLAVHDGGELAGGAVLNRGPGLVGLSNLFAVDGGDADAVWSATLAAVAEHLPGLPVVGYEYGEDLESALAHGFGVLGPLRVWARGS